MNHEGVLMDRCFFCYQNLAVFFGSLVRYQTVHTIRQAVSILSSLRIVHRIMILIDRRIVVL